MTNLKRKRCLYLGHAYHLKTLSTSFVIDFFREHFDVDAHGIDPNSSKLPCIISDINLESYDLVVVFQVEFLLPLIWIRAEKIICFPMYDGCGSMPDKYFKMLAGCAVVNFSSTLHLRCLSTGVESFYIKFYPHSALTHAKSEHDQETISDKSIRIFFWCRNDTVTLKDLERVFPPSLGYSLSLHWARDDGRNISELEIETAQKYKDCKITSWLDRKEEMLEILNECDIYFAPRIAEGIGMGFLDAMSNGLVVAAFDMPTHNEYIINYYNGILYDAGSKEVHMSNKQLSEIKQNNANILNEGRRAFERQFRSLKSFVDEYMDSKTSPFFDGLNPFSSFDQIDLIYQEGHASFVRKIAESSVDTRSNLHDIIALLKRDKSNNPLIQARIIASLGDEFLKNDVVLVFVLAQLLKCAKCNIPIEEASQAEMHRLIKKFLRAISHLPLSPISSNLASRLSDLGRQVHLGHAAA